MNKGYVFAFVTAFLWASYAIFLKATSTYVNDVNGIVVVLQAMISGSFLLLIFAGSGRLSLETLKNSFTWSYGTLQILGNVFSFAALTVALSATSLTLLSRYGIILSILISLIFDNKPNLKLNYGHLILLVGLLIVTSSIPSESRNLTLFWIFLVCLVQVLKTRVAKSHKESNNATGDFKSELRVTGYILAITSIMYSLLIFITMQLNFNEYMPKIIPSFKEFFAIEPLLISMTCGAIIISTMKLTEFKSVKVIGSTNFLTIMAFVPIITYITQYLLYLFNIIPKPITNVYEILGGALIMISAIILTRISISINSNKKLSNKKISELNVLRETIMTAKIAFNDDMELVAKKLGVGKRTIESILKTDKEVSKNIKNKIIYNHAENIAGIDHLTGCLNKISFDIKLQQLDNIEKALLLFIDLDKFKPVNDTYGHDAGDAILKGISERLMAEFKHPNAVARLGGDEYCVLVYGADKSETEKYKKIITSLVTNSFIVEDIEDEISVGCSIGAAHYPTDTQNRLELKGLADKQMYEDKNSKGDVR